MKVYDCFQFFDENMILDLRLNMLNDFVSKFIIVDKIPRNELGKIKYDEL